MHGCLAQWHAWERLESTNRCGIQPQGCTGAGLSLFFPSWVARSHALPQCLPCWNIKNKKRMFSLITTGTNHSCLSECKAFPGNRNLESSKTRSKKTQSKKQQSGKSKDSETALPLSHGVSPVAHLCIIELGWRTHPDTRTGGKQLSYH